MPSKNSKNRKISWRKIRGTGEVNKYFSNINFDVRFGGSITSRPDTQLFKVSKVPHESSLPLTAPTKIKKSCIHFYPDTRIKPIKLPTRSSHKAAISPADSAIIKKRVVALRARTQPQMGRKRARAREWEMFREPLWTEESTDSAACDSDFLQHVKELVRPRRVRTPETLLASRKDKSVVPAVLLPDPGASYIPDEEEHGRLLEKVERGEARRLRAERRVRHSLRGMRRMSGRDIKREEEKQMREGLCDELSRESDSGESGGSTAAPAAINTKSNKKKKKKRKGLALERRRETLDRDKRKLEKRQSEDIRNISSLTKRLDSEVSRKRKRFSAPLTKRLGRLRYREAARDFQLSSEIAASLRGLVSEGSLLRDRYRSLQKRNIIEVRVKCRGKRKYKLKTFLKNSYKEDT